MDTIIITDLMLSQFEARIAHTFRNRHAPAIAYTDYHLHYYSPKISTLEFESIELRSQERPMLLGAAKHQQRLQDIKRKISNIIAEHIALNIPSPEDTDRYLSYILNHLTFIRRLSRSCYITQENDDEHAMAQCWLLLGCIFKDLSPETNYEEISAWLAPLLDPYINEAEKLNFQPLLSLQHTVESLEDTIRDQQPEDQPENQMLQNILTDTRSLLMAQQNENDRLRAQLYITQKDIEKLKHLSTVTQTAEYVIHPNLHYLPIVADGQCLFHAISHHLDEDTESLRERVANYMRNHFDDFISFREGSPEDFLSYIESIRSGYEWGDHIEVEILHRITQQAIIIFRPDSQPIRFDEHQDSSEPPLLLYYNGLDHYDTFTAKNGANMSDIYADIVDRMNAHENLQYSPPRPGVTPTTNYSSLSASMLAEPITIEAPEALNFNQSVFALAQNSAQGQSLAPIRHAISDDEELGNYFSQYIPYIFEEIRASLKEQMRTIAKKRLPPFIATIRYLGQREAGNTIQHIKARTRTEALPKLDHGFYKELISIVYEEETSTELPPKNRSKTQTPPPPKAYLAIAHASKSRNEDEGHFEKPEYTDIDIRLPTDTIRKLELRKGSDVKLHWLCGLIPSERMYEACSQPPSTCFQNQYLRATLPAWPDVPADQIALDESSPLNEKQRQAVNQLVAAETGLYFLQGPPGTGKTTTAAQLLLQLHQQHPDKRILVCAPSNIAVRGLLLKVLDEMTGPPISLALTGIAKDLPDDLNMIYVNNLAPNLYRPLIQFKRDIKSTTHGAQITSSELTEVWFNELAEHITKIKTTLSSLTDHHSLMPIKENTEEALQRLITEAQTQADHLENAISNMQNPTDTSANSRDDCVGCIEQLICTLQDGSDTLECYLVQKAPLVFATLISSGRKWLHKQVGSFPIVVLDEAAQALVPEACIPLHFNPKLYIQIGDPNQLPATITSKEAQERDYENSMMHWIVLRNKQPHLMLEEQYRMHETICSWPSQQYYEGKLITPAKIRERPSLFDDYTDMHDALRSPSLFFNIASGNEHRYGDNYGGSISNEREAEAVINLLSYLLLICRIPGIKIGIITFYNAQKELLKTIIKANNSYHNSKAKKRSRKFNSVTINSVDGFQGREKDIIIISAVRTSPSVGFLHDRRRLNVAMTRAKHARWVIGKQETLIKSNSDMPSFIRFHENGGITDDYEEHKGQEPMPNSPDHPNNSQAAIIEENTLKDIIAQSDQSWIRNR